MGIRPAAVAGTFYPSSPESLKEQIENSFKHPLGPGRLPKAVGGNAKLPVLICPHAGYIYSGPVAAHSYLQLSGRVKPKTVVIFGPNHYGVGSAVSIYPSGSWATPLGNVEIDSYLASKIASRSDMFSLDEFSHKYEHSIEVQVPFLQYTIGDFKLVPICILDQEKGTCVKIGEAVWEAIRGLDVLVIASSDFTHYEHHDTVKRKDLGVLEKIKNLDVDGMYEEMFGNNVTMCGYGAICAALTLAKKMGATEARILKHATSGDVTSDRSSVVGYASAVIEVP